MFHKNVARYVLLNDTLYKRGFSNLLLRCVTDESNGASQRHMWRHINEHVLAKKVLQAGYY